MARSRTCTCTTSLLSLLVVHVCVMPRQSYSYHNMAIIIVIESFPRHLGGMELQSLHTSTYITPPPHHTSYRHTPTVTGSKPRRTQSFAHAHTTIFGAMVARSCGTLIIGCLPSRFLCLFMLYCFTYLNQLALRLVLDRLFWL